MTARSHTRTARKARLRDRIRRLQSAARKASTATKQGRS